MTIKNPPRQAGVQLPTDKHLTLCNPGGCRATGSRQMQAEPWWVNQSCPWGAGAQDCALSPNPAPQGEIHTATRRHVRRKSCTREADATRAGPQPPPAKAS